MKNLHDLYFSQKEYCCKCGAALTVPCGVPLGSVFCMDWDGFYYCSNCDNELLAEDIYDEFYDDEGEDYDN